ncbi:MAG: hypothetical protein M4579_003417 [Chaenotheca gracillima]|nr:MAG: hypothetical protein M4579_003417 [Chaenotheca gracillima]
MYPPSQGLNLDIEAISGISGSVSIACWVVVFSPQIIENFRRGSADGLSLLFLVVWLAGDVFNILGAVLQGVLPTMIILAVYYTLADIVLLGQCFYYRGIWLGSKKSAGESPEPPANGNDHAPDENSALLDSNGNASPQSRQHRPSTSSFHSYTDVHGSHLSPATPLLDAPRPSDPPAAASLRSTSRLQSVLFNFIAIIIVCAAGVFGWWVSNRKAGRDEHDHPHTPDQGSSQSSDLQFSILGQVFGYLCAAFYLGSRVPQLLLNYRRQSTEGVSLLFFLFACIGNLTYVMSIFAYSPICSEHRVDHGHHHRVQRACHGGEAGAIYARYITVNASWILGSFGTLLLDLGVFAQFFIYSADSKQGNASRSEEGAVEVGAPDEGREGRSHS